MTEQLLASAAPFIIGGPTVRLDAAKYGTVLHAD